MKSVINTAVSCLLQMFPILYNSLRSPSSRSGHLITLTAVEVILNYFRFHSTLYKLRVRTFSDLQSITALFAKSMTSKPIFETKQTCEGTRPEEVHIVLQYEINNMKKKG